MKLLFLLSTVLLYTGQALQAQQLAFYNQYRNAQAFINPASVNSDFFLYEYNLNINSTYRAQWITQEGTPRSLQASAEYITDFGGSFELLLGGQVMQDRTGPFGLSGAYGRIGSLFSEDPYWGAFGVGFTFGYVQYTVSASDIIWKDIDDPEILLNDFRFGRPDLGFGLFYYKRLGSIYSARDNIYIGLSVPQILSAQDVIVQDNQQAGIQRIPHYYLSGGWYHFFNADSFLELSSWLKYVEGSNLNADVNARFQPGRTIWFGGGFNFNGLVHLEGGLNIPELMGRNSNLKIAYSFDYSLAALGLQLGTSHELTMALQLATY